MVTALRFRYAVTLLRAYLIITGTIDVGTAVPPRGFRTVLVSPPNLVRLQQISWYGFLP